MSRPMQFIVITAILIGLRVTYVWVEGSYNVALLDMMTTPMLTSSEASEVQELGHKLAALGLALLLTPAVIAFSIKNVGGRTKRVVNGMLTGMAGFLALYIVGYNLQTWIMDEAVESTSAETRYEAYYSSLFRQLYVDGAIEDTDFQPIRTNASQIMWLPFGAASVEDLPMALQTNASELVMERAQKQVALERFESDFDAYRKYQIFATSFLNRYRQVSDEALAKVDPEQTSAANLYGKVVERIYRLYPAYVSINETYREHLGFMASNAWLMTDINALFSASKNERQWMHRALLKKVGLGDASVTVEDWCSSNGCPGSVGHVRSVLREALSNKYASQAYGVPMGLGLKDYLQAPEAFNRALINEGREPVFGDSKVTFDRFESKVAEASLAPDLSGVLARWFPGTESLKIPAGLSDRSILESSVFKDLVAQKVGNRIADFPVTLNKKQFFAEWLQVSSDVLKEKRDVLLPATPEQMMEGDAQSAGLAAVRLLYIPPFAAAMSGLMIVLNLAAIGSALLFANRYGWQVRVAVVVFVAATSFVVGATKDMPTSYVADIWSAYSTDEPLNSAGWEIFFGVEAIISSAAKQTNHVATPATINQALDKTLGWAL